MEIAHNIFTPNLAANILPGPSQWVCDTSLEPFWQMKLIHEKNPALRAPHAPDAPKCVPLTTKLVLLSNYGIARNFIMYSDFFGPVIIRVLALQEGKTKITKMPYVMPP